MDRLTQSNKHELATPVQVNPSASLVLRYSISSVFCPKSGSSFTTASSWHLEENSEGRNRSTPARIAASTYFFWSPRALAPTAEITASLPWKAASRFAGEKLVLRTITSGGKVSSLSLRAMTVIAN